MIKIKEFNPPALAIMMHIMAKTRYKPCYGGASANHDVHMINRGHCGHRCSFPLVRLIKLLSSCSSSSSSLGSWPTGSRQKSPTMESRVVAKILWSHAKMKRQPGEQGPLEARSEEVAREYNLQDVADTLWACGVIERKPGEQVMRVLDSKVESFC